ncbi:MAG: BolA family transcriptional regulator [Zetaproteobacteria bacterium]|nr:MAG: BolA family transcriptional regulator [Zetaproteobacteria bacterium]
MTNDTVEEKIRERLERALQPSRLVLHDQSAAHAGHGQHRAHGGGHYCLEIAADCFAGRPLAECHRMVHRALGDMFSEDIHALSIKVIR